jgi:hypothetical protein
MPMESSLLVVEPVLLTYLQTWTLNCTRRGSGGVERMDDECVQTKRNSLSTRVNLKCCSITVLVEGLEAMK